jgi:ribonucleoside-diphosphate reductase alpha chain
MRNRLPNTRLSISHKVRIGDVSLHIIVGLYKKGTPGELFIKAGHGAKETEGFGLQGWCDTIGILVSIALQSAVPLKLICVKMRGQNFEPSGLTRDHGFAKSVPDYLAKWLWATFGEGSLI